VWVRGNDGVRLGVGKRLSQINNGWVPILDNGWVVEGLLVGKLTLLGDHVPPFMSHFFPNSLPHFFPPLSL